MTDQTPYPNRKSPRLAEYDYAQNGAYFVTICTHRRVNLFGAVSTEGAMVRSQWGEIAYACWQEIPEHFAHVVLDQFVVMPNHVHGILFLLGDNANSEQNTPPQEGVGDS